MEPLYYMWDMCKSTCLIDKISGMKKPRPNKNKTGFKLDKIWISKKKICIFYRFHYINFIRLRVSFNFFSGVFDEL